MSHRSGEKKRRETLIIGRYIRMGWEFHMPNVDLGLGGGYSKVGGIDIQGNIHTLWYLVADH